MASRIASQNRWPALLHLAGLILDCWHHMASVPSLTTLRYPWTSCQPFDGSYLAGQNPNQTLSGTLFGTNMEGKNLFVKEHGVPRGHSPFWFQGSASAVHLHLTTNSTTSGHTMPDWNLSKYNQENTLVSTQPAPAHTGFHGFLNPFMSFVQRSPPK